MGIYFYKVKVACVPDQLSDRRRRWVILGKRVFDIINFGTGLFCCSSTEFQKNTLNRIFKLFFVRGKRKLGKLIVLYQVKWLDLCPVAL